MRMPRLILALTMVLGLTPTAEKLMAQTRETLPAVLMVTELGEIVVEVDTVRAPISGNNFLRYVDGGFYDGGSFHRTVTPDNQPNDSIRIQVIQGNIAREEWENTYGAIPLERTSVTGLLHRNGTISMARSGPDTAVASFFVCVGDQPELDFGGKRNLDGQGFAAFGRVVAGMDVVRRINSAPADGQSLDPAIVIVSASRTDPTSR